VGREGEYVELGGDVKAERGTEMDMLGLVCEGILKDDPLKCDMDADLEEGYGSHDPFEGPPMGVGRECNVEGIESWKPAWPS
jgi:hypothetical protein